MRFSQLAVPMLFGLLALTTAGIADAGWQPATSHKHVSGKTSLKVSEPKGFKVKVVVEGAAKEDSVPAIFALPDVDAFVSVTLTAPDGHAWTDKVEIKAHQQTDLTMKYEAAPAAAAAPSGRTFLGHVENASGRCAAGEDRLDLKADIITPATGAVAGSFTVTPNKEAEAHVESGVYEVRFFTRPAGSTSSYIFKSTQKINIAQDGWLFSWGCRTTSKRERPSFRIRGQVN